MCADGFQRLESGSILAKVSVAHVSGGKEGTEILHTRTCNASNDDTQTLALSLFPLAQFMSLAF